MKLVLNERKDYEDLVDTLTSPGWERLLAPVIQAQVDLVSNVKSVNAGPNALYELGLAHGQLEVLEGWSGLLARAKALLAKMDEAAPKEEAHE